ncbi:CPBP family intramembrane metalloprotease [Hymenobacter sp. J193]|uniref:CPBP family intramembrane glutamic endopeptidase n=1 Tax=Hymenobacter sp. J193 TaxID=2898429 RepID=UPI002150CA4E|nr:CPBP family intramembrane glutamic endopeptidase [Hymenobacter sp. J193]MCR5887005.1 CPBP family intramembrane metalloprotease [Hymenobacter sp. J193]
MQTLVAPPPSPFVRAFAASWFRFTWKTGAGLVAVFTLVRFALVLHANITQSYQLVAFIFVAMVLLPFVVLTRAGRQKIGWVMPTRWSGMLLGAALGAGSCAALFYLTTFLFGVGEGNSLAYVARSYGNIAQQLNEHNRLTSFLIFSGPSMVFSPIGEELFYRGLVHECFAGRLGQRGAAVADSAAFALVHLAHFGFIYAGTGAGWRFLPGPALVWVVALFGTCLLFSVARRRSGSVVGAMVAHALFNLTMNYFIFYHLL